MSTKCTIFLTNDNEHCYEETIAHAKGRSGTEDFEIVMEFDPKNFRIESNDEYGLVISLTDPDSKIFKLIKSLKQ
jgi:hypothetical protein